MNSDEQLVYLPSFKARNSTKYTSVFAIAESNLRSLYLENRQCFANFEKFIEGLEVVLKIEFGVESDEKVRFVVMADGERIVFESEESMDERPLVLENVEGVMQLGVYEQAAPHVSKIRDVFTKCPEASKETKMTKAANITDEEMDDKLITEYGQLLRTHTNYVLINKLLDHKNSQKNVFEHTRLSQFLNSVVTASFSQLRNKNKNEFEMYSYEMTSLLAQMDERKDHMVVAMNIFMFLIRHQVVHLNLSQPKDSQLSWNKAKLNSLCSQATKLANEDSASTSGSSETLSTEASTLDIELVK